MRVCVIALIVSLIVPIFSFGQIDSTIQKSDIQNTDWIIAGYTIKDSFNSNIDDGFFSFKASIYHWLTTKKGILNSVKDTTVMVSGKWTIVSDTMISFAEHSVSGYWFKTPQRYWFYKILSSTKDTLIVKNPFMPDSKIYLAKVKKLKFKTPILDSINETPNPIINNFWIVPKQKLQISSTTGKKKINIGFKEYITVVSNQTNYIYEGNLFSCDSQNLYIRLHKFKYNYLDQEGTSTNCYTYYDRDTANRPILKNSLIQKLPYNQIASISYSKISPGIPSTMLAISMASLLGAMVVAPLSSYNFKTGNFNHDLFFKIFTPCSISFAFSFPIYISTEGSEKKIRLNNHWQLSPKK